jgi:hypothetical protein
MSEHAFEFAVAEQPKSELERLLLTPEQEQREARRRGEPPYVLTFEQGENKLTVYGTKHAFFLEDVQEMQHRYDLSGADILLVEGDIRVIPENVTNEEILQEYGEQGFMARYAQKQGTEVMSWDMPALEYMRHVIQRHSPDAIIGWMIGQSVKHILSQKRLPTPEAVQNMIQLFLTPEIVQAAQAATKAFNIDTSHLDEISVRYAGKTIEALTFQDGENLATPRHRGETNDVIRDINDLRDKHALKIIADAKQRGKTTIFVTTGASHALTWEPALRQMYR